LSDQGETTELGRRVRQLREARGWSQEQLARRAGLGLMAINRIETGQVRQPKRTSVQQIALALEVPGEQLEQLLTEPAANGAA
jgi:XRE family transcriptional regulator, regulator of sulfur utilization